MQSKIIIGVDPAFRRGGFGVCILDLSDRTTRFLKLRDFLAFLSWFLHDAPAEAVFVVENSNLQKVTFDTRGNKATVATKSRSVGKNQAISQATADVIRLNKNYKLIELSPRQKGAKWNEKTAYLVAKRENIKVGDLSKEDDRDALKLAVLGLNKRYY